MEEQENEIIESESSMSFKDIYRLCLANWKWFAISVACCLFLGVIYLLRTAPVYTRTASVLIKDDNNNGRGISSDMNIFSDLGLFSSQSNVNNELSTIKSPEIVLETVRRLHLDMNYFEGGTFYDKALYGKDLPVRVTIVGLSDADDCGFELEVDPAGEVTLSDCKYNGESTAKSDYKGYLNKFIATPFGRVLVQRNDKSSEPVKLKVYRGAMVATMQDYRDRLDAMLEDKKATIIDLTYQDVSTQRAEDFLNTLINVYNESWVKDKNQIAVSTSHFIDERLDVIQKELGSVDNAISTYKSNNLIPDVAAASQVYMQQASSANAMLVNLRNELYIARYIHSFITNEKNANQLLPANSGIGNTTIEKQIADYDEKLLQRNSLAFNSSTSNPLVQDLDKSLAAMRVSITAAVENQINALNTQISGYNNEQNISNSQIASSPTKTKYLLPKERQQKVKEELYLYLLQKREENELSQAFTAYNTRVISSPMGSNTPTSPVRRNVFLLAFLIGLVIPAAVIIIRENLNTTIRGRKDVEGLTVPFIGELPQVGKRRRMSWSKLLDQPFKKPDKEEEEKKEVLVEPNNRNVINEAFRVIRSNVELMLGAGTDKKVIMMSSMNAGSGKTFVAVNLSACFAIKGKRVAAIDLDLRKATLSKYVGEPRHGVTDLLIGRADDWHELIVHPANCKELDVIPVGTIPPNPSELLFSPKLNNMIQEMRAEYDLVFIDCPPVGIVADSSAIMKWADLTIFIIRAGLFEREMLPDVDKYYTEKRIPNMALLLNGTEAVRGSYHRYGYGYGYGYGNTDDGSNTHHHHHHKA